LFLVEITTLVSGTELLQKSDCEIVKLLISQQMPILSQRLWERDLFLCNKINEI